MILDVAKILVSIRVACLRASSNHGLCGHTTAHVRYLLFRLLDGPIGADVGQIEAAAAYLTRLCFDRLGDQTCSVRVCVFQISHHPPISVFHVTNRQDGFSASGSVLAKSKFYGKSAVLTASVHRFCEKLELTTCTIRAMSSLIF